MPQEFSIELGEGKSLSLAHLMDASREIGKEGRKSFLAAAAEQTLPDFGHAGTSLFDFE